MGRDAAVDVWYGVLFASDEYDVVADVAEFVNDLYEEGESWEIEGVEIRTFAPAEEADIVGFGIELVYHDWDYPPVPWDEFQARATRTLKESERHALRTAAEKFNISPERFGTFVHTRYW